MNLIGPTLFTAPIVFMWVHAVAYVLLSVIAGDEHA